MKDVQTRYGTPRTVAGEGIETDVNKCTLKPLRRLDYYPLDVHRQPVAAPRAGVPDRRLRLEQAGVDQAGAIPWQTYQDGSGNVVYGGRPLGPAPAGSGGGWTSAAFASWRG